MYNNRFRYDTFSLSQPSGSTTTHSSSGVRAVTLTSYVRMMFTSERGELPGTTFRKGIHFAFLISAVCFIFLKMPRKKHSQFRKKLSKLMEERNKRKKNEKRQEARRVRYFDHLRAGHRVHSLGCLTVCLSISCSSSWQWFWWWLGWAWLAICWWWF